VVVPVAAVQISDGRYFAYVVQGDKVKRTEIKIGVDGGDWLEVVSGLAPGAEIVTAGTDVLADGSTVRPVRGMDPFTGKVPAATTGPGR
jgi:multidrug efflux pump subunit AcrA (membrane-fusion protein)